MRGFPLYLVTLFAAACEVSDATPLEPLDRAGGPDASLGRDAGPSEPVDAGAVAPSDASVAAPLDGGSLRCVDRNEATCGDDPACAPFVCSGCFGEGRFVCYAAADGPPVCGRPDCRCAQLGEAGCGEAPGCHPVYADRPERCGCDAPGCCMVFERCASGGRADCSFTEPLCERPAPICGPGFSVSYADDCFEGCARNEDCVF